MRVFLSWSGARSRLLAEALRAWIPKVLQSVRPWMSDEDIAAGTRWAPEIASMLGASSFGLICVTPENQSSPWLMFETGALSKTLDDTYVCPLLLGLSPGELVGPLVQFQAVEIDEGGIGRVIHTMNDALRELALPRADLDETLAMWWPRLAERLAALPQHPTVVATRTLGDQMDELIQLSREQHRRELTRLDATVDRDRRLDAMLTWFDNTGLSPMEIDEHMRRQKEAAQSVEFRDLPSLESSPAASNNLGTGGHGSRSSGGESSQSEA